MSVTGRRAVQPRPSNQRHWQPVPTVSTNRQQLLDNLRSAADDNRSDSRSRKTDSAIRRRDFSDTRVSG